MSCCDSKKNKSSYKTDIKYQKSNDKFDGMTKALCKNDLKKNKISTTSQIKLEDDKKIDKNLKGKKPPQRKDEIKYEIKTEDKLKGNKSSQNPNEIKKEDNMDYSGIKKHEDKIQDKVGNEPRINDSKNKDNKISDLHAEEEDIKNKNKTGYVELEKKNYVEFDCSPTDEKNKVNNNSEDKFRKYNNYGENKDNNMHKYGYDYLGYNNYKYSSIRIKGAIGLRNLGNTCFMNSSLQCLSHIEALYNQIKLEQNLGQLGLSFKKLLEKIYDNLEDKYFIPNNILSVMSLKYEQYNERRQQGANEFISNFLKVLHDELNTDKHKEKIFTEPSPSEEVLLKKYLHKKKFYEKNKSIIIDLFYGNIVYLTQCNKCDNIISALYSIYNILELSIYNKRKKENVYLEELIEDFSSKKENEYTIKCQKCKKEVIPYSKMLIAHSPDILIIYINKVIDHIYYDNNIIFPCKLDLNTYIKQEDKMQNYNLIGIIEHNGTESFGHYTSKCYNFIDGNWYSFNDSFVDKEIIPNYKDNYSKSSEVMLLFYKRD